MDILNTTDKIFPKMNDKQRSMCRHAIIVINSMVMKAYCKRCHKNLSDSNFHSFVAEKIMKNKWEKSYNGNVRIF
jgi:hypothetical protein